MLQRNQNPIDVANQSGTNYTIIVVDQALFCKAFELKWSAPDYKRVILRLGELHTSMCFQSIIGDYVAENGFRDNWVRAGVIGQLKADKIVQIVQSWNEASHAD